jgi:polyhydroxybutyrate depolymerase
VGPAVADERSSTRSEAPGTHRIGIIVEGIEREYLVHVPPVYDRLERWPVVVMFHGGGGNARAAMRETGWNAKADTEGFLAVFPEGTPTDPSRPGRFRDNPQTWNDGSDRPSVGATDRDAPDVTFVSAILADLQDRFSVDPYRIYVTGFSNGASMAFRAARELSPSVAAAAPVAGSDWMTGKVPERYVPILYVTGTADPLNLLEGGEIFIGAKSFGVKPAIQEMIANWAKMHGCPDPRHVVNDEDGVAVVEYGQPGEAAKVVLYTIEGQGHHWPGGQSALPASLAGRKTAKVNATDVIWAFFESHILPD